MIDRRSLENDKRKLILCRLSLSTILFLFLSSSNCQKGFSQRQLLKEKENMDRAHSLFKEKKTTVRRSYFFFLFFGRDLPPGQDNEKKDPRKGLEVISRPVKEKKKERRAGRLLPAVNNSFSKISRALA